MIEDEEKRPTQDHNNDQEHAIARQVADLQALNRDDPELIGPPLPQDLEKDSTHEADKPHKSNR